MSKQQYLSRAQDCVALANAAKTDTGRQTFLELAETWKKLAEKEPANMETVAAAS